MLSWRLSRNISSMRLLTELAADHGLPPANALRNTGITAAQLNDPDKLVNTGQELQLIHNIVTALDTVPALGIEAGKRYHFSSFGALSFAMISSRNSRDALDVALQYLHLTFALTQFQATDTKRHTLVSIETGSLPETVKRFIVERDSATLVTVQRELFDAGPVIEAIAFNFAAPDYVDAYTAFYGITPGFDAGQTQITLDRARLELPLPLANAEARASAEFQCRQMLDRLHARSGLAAQLRADLAARAAAMPTMNAMAADLCLTPRTLRRRLQEEGTTFSELRDEVRRMLATEFLAIGHLPVELIAERLGYANATSFINAFKRWYGVTPHVYRRRTDPVNS